MTFNKLYLGFCLGSLITGTLLSYIIVSKFTSNEYLRQNTIYLDGAFYQLCKRPCK